MKYSNSVQMGVAERKQREKMLLREEILEAARDLFVKHGYESVSMRKIAERIEYSPTTIYLYFRDKEALLESLCTDTFAKLSKTLEGLARDHADPVQRLKSGMHAYIEFGLKHPNDYQVTFMMKHHGRQTHEKEQPGMRAFQCLLSSVEACLEAGRFETGDAMAISQVLWTSIHGVTSLLIACVGFPWIERKTLIDMVVESSVAGFEK